MFILVQNKEVNEPLFPFLSTSLNLNASHIEQKKRNRGLWELGVAFYSFANIRLNFLESKVLFWKEKAESLFENKVLLSV